MTRSGIRAIVPAAAAVLIGLPAGPGPATAQSAAVVPATHNPASPSGGRETLRLRELWRAGADDDAVLIGTVQQALSDEQGHLYLLDRQLSQVHVFSPEGEFLRSLSREGEGPGESRQPADLFWTADGDLGIVQGFPARVVRIDPAGQPRESLPLGQSDPAAGGFRFAHGALSRAGVLAFSGGEMKMAEGGVTPISFLSLCNPDGSERARLLEKTGDDIMRTRRWVEKDEYFVHGGRWTIGRDGRIYAAPERGRYLISVFGPDGAPQATITRDFEPRRRTAEERAAARGNVRIVANGRRVDIEEQIDDFEPCVMHLEARPDGELWVIHSRSALDLPPGVMQIYDAFDPAGVFVREVAVAGEGDAREDRLFLLGADRALLVNGYQGSLRISMGTGGGDEGGDELPVGAGRPLEIICYAVE
ncbi:MAG: hypothetical protein FJY75_05775 [Candidatus Eisenbacteria bacterium]|uniref:6-bladed beta-propeller n=1 Tax=Eiseniibacteriota bacterium TaxID=2212470 RepID=A0A938BQM6_UNCEI|nr:hypothetical protein [Candidatus Eisenbacteria bacterium]